MMRAAGKDIERLRWYHTALAAGNAYDLPVTCVLQMLEHVPCTDRELASACASALLSDSPGSCDRGLPQESSPGGASNVQHSL